ncbi:beta-1,3-glucan-binding protein-like [Physella acuta]|uniref:beta-1,3-glucan-binding protein-like n=1 Tax=Physella acuta TaxID=109671 RepID=UPI0027DCB458|nr:beta-1,3-glucan-binding protein-like [Physella acuta]XP_059163531.1 beta-1,3-glucan-binding protein-like [Physella acuta]
MFKFVLLALAVVPAIMAIQVAIRYQEPLLSLTLHDNSRDIASVAFHYITNNVNHQARGVRLSDGWQYQTRDARLDGADGITSYAVAYNAEGRVLYTSERSHLALNGNRGVAVLPGRKMRGAVIFRDDFNSLNTGNWKYEVSMFGGMNWEFQVYTPEAKNVFVRNGNLFLMPTLTVDDPRWDENFLHTGKMDVAQIWGYCTNSGNYGCVREGQYGMLPPIMSGKITSIPTLRYGIVEVRAKIPKGDWIWPAIWMMPRDSAYGGWPRSGEIDIMESRGNNGDIGVGTVSSTLHWGPAWDNNKWDLTHGERHTGSWHDNFHTWKLEWTPDHLITFVDNQKIMEVTPGANFWQKGGFSGPNIWASGEKMAPFDKDFYMIFNVAVGGTNGFFPDNANWGVRKPWANNSPQAAQDFWNGRHDWQPTWQGDQAAMQIDWVEFRNL